MSTYFEECMFWLLLFKIIPSSRIYKSNTEVHDTYIH